MAMKVFTIPKALTAKDDLVILPRREYEKLLECTRQSREKEIELTPAQKRRLKQGRANFVQGKTLTVYELRKKLGFGG